MTRPIAISDSANFYVSAERIFDPTLKGVPVIVLSNNDGCALARSDEAKALGIKMGEPLHLIRDKIAAHGVRVFSSNYTLYGDISRRVVAVYEDYTPNVEIYSIDECFLDFGGFKDRVAHAKAMRRDVLRRVGVPVRVGIAPTKTLAKCANDIAKKNPIFGGVLDMTDSSLADWLLPLVPVGDIWGIGRKTEAKLQGVGINTAAELRAMPLRQARAMGTVVLERTVLELQGEPCIAFDDVEPQRKGMAVTRSAGTPMQDFDTPVPSHHRPCHQSGGKAAPAWIGGRNADCIFPYEPTPRRQAAICWIQDYPSHADVFRHIRSGCCCQAMRTGRLAKDRRQALCLYQGGGHAR